MGDYTPEEIYNMLSDEDKAALEHGHKMCCRSRRKRIIKAVSIILSACVTIVIGIYFVIKLNRRKSK